MSTPAKTDPVSRPALAGTGVMTGSIEVDDVWLWEHASRPWELLVLPLDAGHFRCTRTYLATPSVILYREAVTAGVHIQGLTPADHLAVSVPLHTGPRTSYWGREWDHSQLPSTTPGAIDVVLDARHDHLILLVPMGLLAERLDPDHLADLARSADRGALGGAPAQSARFSDWLCGVLSRAQAAPRALAGDATRLALEEQLLGWLDRLGSSAEGGMHAAHPSNRRRGLNRALDYLRHADPARVTVADLRRAARVSERTLQYAFHEQLGLGPLAYIRRRRLHAARRLLAIADRDQMRVADIAYLQGFFELGRFAADHRRLFGELPSETLAHRRAVVPSPLLLN